MKARRDKNQVHDMRVVEASERDPRITLSALAAVTALVLAFNAPTLPDATTSSFSSAQPSIIEHVMEWRPQGPPPWMDVDQLTPEEVEEVPAASGGDTTLSGGDAAPSGRGGSELRERPRL